MVTGGLRVADVTGIGCHVGHWGVCEQLLNDVSINGSVASTHSSKSTGL